MMVYVNFLVTNKCINEFGVKIEGDILKTL